MATTAAPPADPLSPLLQGYAEQLRFIRREAAELTGGLTDAQFAWRSEPGRWSVAEIVDHLVRGGRSYVAVIEPALASGRARGLRDRGDFRPSLIGRLMVRSMEPSTRIRFRAPAIYRPAAIGPALERERALAAWRALHDDVERQIRGAAGLDLRRMKIVSPVTPLVRMNAGDALALVLTHERRHLAQLRNVVRHAAFPAS